MNVVFALSVILTACGPSDFERQKLAFEQQKYNDEQAAKAAADLKEANDRLEQSIRWRSCRDVTHLEYVNEFKIWGEPFPGKPGNRSGPANQLQDMKNRVQRKNEECDRNFPKGIGY